MDGMLYIVKTNQRRPLFVDELSALTESEAESKLRGAAFSGGERKLRGARPLDNFC